MWEGVFKENVTHVRDLIHNRIGVLRFSWFCFSGERWPSREIGTVIWGSDQGLGKEGGVHAGTSRVDYIVKRAWCWDSGQRQEHY